MDNERIMTGYLTADADLRNSGELLLRELELRRRILERFPVLETRLHILRRCRMSLDPLSRRDFEKVFRFLSRDCGFVQLKLLTAVNSGDNLMLDYVLADKEQVLILLKERVSKASPVVRSVCDRYPTALWSERMLTDLYGIVFEDAPVGPSFPLPHDWPQKAYPLRSEWRREAFDRRSMTYDLAYRDHDALHEPEN